MKYLLAAALAATALAGSAPAQEPTPKPRKFLMFLPGSKKHAPTPQPEVPVAKAVPKTTPKATPKATPRTTPKPAAKTTPKPATPAEAKAATPEPKTAGQSESKPATPVEPKTSAPAAPTPSPLLEQKPEEKLRSTSVEALSPSPAPPTATPAPKSTVPPRNVSARVAATPTPAKLPPGAVAKTAPAVAVVAASAASEKTAAPAAPAVITSTVPPEPAQIVRAFFALLSTADIDGAYASLMKGSKIGDRPDEVRTLKAKTRDAIDIFGAIHGYDLVDIKPVGERLMRATYLSLGHELPLRWRFYFYKAEADWKLIDLRVDDKLTGIFDEAMEDLPRPSAETRP